MRVIKTKQNSKPLLSICIPTYNRDFYLKKCIDSIIKQQCFLDGTVEVVVSDNASTDNTKKTCMTYDNMYSNFTYICLDKNIKDRNFPYVISNAQGIYRKIFTDSYVCLDNKLSEMCEVIKHYMVNRPHICWSISKYIVDRNSLKIECFDFKEFVLKLGERITNLIYFGLWEDDCDDILSDLDACDMMIWQADKTLKVSYKKNNIIVYNNIIVSVQNIVNKNVKYNIFNVFYKNYLCLINKYVKNFTLSNKDFYKIKRKMLFDTFYNWSLKWKDKKLNWDFDDTENLPNEIKKAYERELYYPFFIIKLNVMRFLRIMKRMIKG